MNIKTEIIEKRKLLKKETILNWIHHFYKRNDEPFKEIIRKCIDNLYDFMDTKIIAFEGLYKIFEIYRESLTDTEYLTLIRVTEEVIQDYLKLAVLESKERVKKINDDFMVSKGYIPGKVYQISYPDNPKIPEEKWLVTEFRTHHDLSIRPWYGHKIRKDGQPAIRETFISLADSEALIKPVENEK